MHLHCINSYINVNFVGELYIRVDLNERIFFIKNIKKGISHFTTFQN